MYINNRNSMLRDDELKRLFLEWIHINNPRQIYRNMNDAFGNVGTTPTSMVVTGK